MPAPGLMRVHAVSDSQPLRVTWTAVPTIGRHCIDVDEDLPVFIVVSVENKKNQYCG